MSMNEFYKKLEKLNSGVLYEREMERAFVALLDNYAAVGEGMEDAKIYPSVRGVPLVMGDAVEDAEDAISEARNRTSYVVVIASGYEDAEGDQSCTLRIVISTKLYDGTGQEERHEKWCAAVRGIMSYAGQMAGVLEAFAALNTGVTVAGWERDEQPPVDQYLKSQWVHEETYHVTGVLSCNG